MNLAAGETVTEIEIFEVKLAEPKLDESVLRQIDKESRPSFGKRKKKNASSANGRQDS